MTTNYSTLSFSKVCSIGNRLAANGHSRKEAFSIAWQIIKNGLSVSVAGVTFGNRQTALKRITAYDVSQRKVYLEPEPGNPFDHSAVKVLVSINNSAKYHLGYLPKGKTHYAKILNQNSTLKIVSGSWSHRNQDYETYGARLVLAV